MNEQVLTKEVIQKECGISDSTFYRLKKKGILEQIGPTGPQYSIESVMKVVTYYDVRDRIGS